jgi:aspartate-semialdehyde dehydrogenase
MKIAVVGATGLVGREMIKVLEEHKINTEEFYPVASERSVGTEIEFNKKKFKVISLQQAVDSRPDIALFSAGGAVSKQWAPRFAEKGTTVIDNSSAWRMEKNIPLVVPEVNATILKKENKIIANPNCSTIQLVVVLAPLHREYKIRRLVISTYQSVTGTGVAAVKQLEEERKGTETKKIYPYPHGGDFTSNGYTTEEIKLVNETQKILDDYSIGITSTVVRIPVIGGHSESVNIEFEKEFDLEDIKSLLVKSKGIILQDDPIKKIYPMPLFCKGKDEVFVGRIRRDESQPKTLNLWIVADNLRKGAATNAVQIAEYLIEHQLK